jgi:phosphoglycerate dehydrogenase-like enzyme
MSELKAVLPQADFVALTCPLTAETRPRSTNKNQ